MTLVHRASRNRTPNNADTEIAAADCEEFPQTPLTVEVSAKMIDQPFIILSPFLCSECGLSAGQPVTA